MTFDDEPLYEMPALTGSKRLEEINIDTVAFCPKKDYVESSMLSRKRFHTSEGTHQPFEEPVARPALASFHARLKAGLANGSMFFA